MPCSQPASMHACVTTQELHDRWSSFVSQFFDAGAPLALKELLRQQQPARELLGRPRPPRWSSCGGRGPDEGAPAAPVELLWPARRPGSSCDVVSADQGAPWRWGRNRHLRGGACAWWRMRQRLRVSCSCTPPHRPRCQRCAPSPMYGASRAVPSLALGC
jgi:hypothetical protein